MSRRPAPPPPPRPTPEPESHRAREDRRSFEGIFSVETLPDFKDPVLATLLSIVLPGAGQVYNHHFVKGILVFGTCWLIFPYFLGILDAFVSARSQNRVQMAGFRHY